MIGISGICIAAITKIPEIIGYIPGCRSGEMSKFVLGIEIEIALAQEGSAVNYNNILPVIVHTTAYIIKNR